MQRDRSGTVRVVGAVLPIQKALRRQARGQHHVVLRQFDVYATRSTAMALLVPREKTMSSSPGLNVRSLLVTLAVALKVGIAADVLSAVRCSPGVGRDQCSAASLVSRKSRNTATRLELRSSSG